MIAAMLMAAQATAKQPRIASAYTKFDYKHCKVIEEDKEAGGGTSRCLGYAKIPLFLSHDDERDDLDAGVQNQGPAVEGPMHYVSRTVEWRLADGKPFAIIFRLATSPEHGKWSRLIVETIGRPGRPGCPVAAFNGLDPKANAAARMAADAVLSGKAKCLSWLN